MKISDCSEFPWKTILLSTLIFGGAKPVYERKLAGHAGVTNLLVRLVN